MTESQTLKRCLNCTIEFRARSGAQRYCCRQCRNQAAYHRTNFRNLSWRTIPGNLPQTQGGGR